MYWWLSAIELRQVLAERSEVSPSLFPRLPGWLISMWDRLILVGWSDRGFDRESR